MTFLDKLKQDPGCLYIYNWGPYVYGLSKEPTEYIIIVTDNHPDFKDEYAIKQDNVFYQIYKIKDWFNKVLLGSIDCWECACLNKKYIIKEHVKLMMTTNPLQLRKEIDGELLGNPPELLSKEELVNYYWRIIRHCKFANQIIDNHKITNFNEANSDYLTLSNTDNIEECYNNLISKSYKYLKQKTDELLRKDKIEKFLKKKDE